MIHLQDLFVQANLPHQLCLRDVSQVLWIIPSDFLGKNAFHLAHVVVIGRQQQSICLKVSIAKESDRELENKISFRRASKLK